MCPRRRRVETCPPESDAALFFLLSLSLAMKNDRSRERSAEAPELGARVHDAPAAERRETRRTDPALVVGQLLEEVRLALQGHPESRERRTLMGKLERFDTAVARWSAFPPHDDQVAAMLEVLNALQAAIPPGP